MSDRPKTATGPQAVLSSLSYTTRNAGLIRGLEGLHRVNQKNGFDCPGCAWPDPEHRSVAEFCENGARAVGHEADSKTIDASFFAAHSIEWLRTQSAHWLEHQGRLAEPMARLPGAAHYTAISWGDAFTMIAHELRALPSPDAAAFYTSGRASNEAAFLYQLLARSFGTNNLPDCSNMCHESSGVGLGTVIGVGKGTVTLEDFEKTDCIFIIGQNPGTNHPRMLSTLRRAAERGAKIIAVNPLKEVALISFADPQTPSGLLGIGTQLATEYVQVRINGDVPFIKGVMKAVLEAGAIDRAFIDEHTRGFEALHDDVNASRWSDLEAASGISEAQMRSVAKTYCESNAVIACWAMGLTQHKNGVANVREVVNLLALRGNIGRPGAGVCPVRGHSNVQGDRTMGIYEAPSEAFLEKLDHATGLTSPRKRGHDVVGTIAAMEAGEVQLFISLGGNFASATPDTNRTVAALKKCRLTVQISTKLNRSHLEHGQLALILPCLGRTEDDHQQFVTVEDSMSMVHMSRGRLKPRSPQMRGEPWIVAQIAQATLSHQSGVDWEALGSNYDLIRDLIARSIDGFEDFNARVRHPGGFHLRNTAAHREWKTEHHRLELTVQSIPVHELRDGELLMMSIRTHDQFNTTIYEMNDRYRGVRGDRLVIFMNPADVEALGLAAGGKVGLSHGTRHLSGFTVKPYDIPRGNCATYYPETNPLVPLESFADESRTPASKSVPIKVTRE